MNPPQMFRVIIADSRKTNGQKVRLPCERTTEEVARLRTGYEYVEAVPIMHEEPTKRADDEGAYREAINSLVRVHRVSRLRGDAGLANRAEEAMSVLLGAASEGPEGSKVRPKDPRSEDETR